MKSLFVIFFVNLIIVSLWFKEGLLFAGAEEQLSFYNYSKSLDLFSHVWYAAGTGYSALTSLPRVPYFLIGEVIYRIGFSSIFLEAVTFLILILIGMVSAYYLVKVIITAELEKRWQESTPLLAALFYFFNPFSLTQIWGRALPYQFFSFALVPSFLLFFVLSLRRKNIFFCLVGALISLLLSNAYVSPSVVITSWGAVIIYLIVFLYQNRKDKKELAFGLLSFLILLLFWTIVNYFWIYPTIIQGKEMFIENLAVNDNVKSLQGLSPHSTLQNVLRLIHREYYDDTYPGFFNSILVIIISWLLPIFVLFAIPVAKKTKHFLFFPLLGIVSIFITIGANFPTGWLLVWLFKVFPLLQVLRNPYEKFGINLVIAFAPFFAIGFIRLSNKLTKISQIPKLQSFFNAIFVFAYFVILVWPYWNGTFAGGNKANFWVAVPYYYTEANNWLNNQQGDFRILHLPLIPEEGITFTWPHPYEGVEASEFIFDKSSIARNTGINSGYYSVLLERFEVSDLFKAPPYWSDDNEDFKDDSLARELTKLNVRYIIVHLDTDFEKRKTRSPAWVEGYLDKQEGIKKIITFGQLDIYQVNIPANIQMVYSPDSNVSYQRISPTEYTAYIKDAKTQVRLNFLEQYHSGWEAYIGSMKMGNHTKIFSYANSWLIDKTGNYQVNIRYKPQESFYFGSKVTLATVILLSFVLIGYFFKIRNKFF